jgi:hypothetical protein
VSGLEQIFYHLPTIVMPKQDLLDFFLKSEEADAGEKATEAGAVSYLYKHLQLLISRMQSSHLHSSLISGKVLLFQAQVEQFACDSRLPSRGSC